MRPALALALVLPVLLAPPAFAQSGDPVEVEVGLYVVNIGNYDANRGTYVIDFYLWLAWNSTAAPAGFSPEKFEFMNGRATAKDRIFEATDPATGGHEVWFRIQANLYSDPRFESYPYDRQTLEIVFEDAVNERSALVYRPLRDESGLDATARVAGWRTVSTTMETGTKEYPFDESYDRVRFALVIEREPLAATMKAFLPPLAFVVVSGLAFFFHASKVAQRLSLGTSMLISAVGFHISQTINLPAAGRLMLFDEVMLAVYTFIALSLVVTTLIAMDEDYWKDRDFTRPINRWGAAATTLVPLLVFAVLAAL